MSHPENTKFYPATTVEVDIHQDGQRLDNFLMAQFRELPKGRIYQMIRKGEVRINKGRAKPISRLNAGDIVRLPPVKVELKEEIHIPDQAWKALQPHILFENTDFMIVDKPSGIAVHAGSEIPYGIIEIIKAFSNHDFHELVQRLDRETSGLLLIAKTGKALRELQHTDLTRQYTLVVAGNWQQKFPQETTIITDSLDTENRQNGERHVIVSNNGKEAETHFSLLKQGNRASLLNAILKTGRTHQIRVHSSANGFPILGDQRYFPNDSSSAKRLMLHASLLSFILFEENYTFQSPIPHAFTDILQRLNR